MTAPTLSILIPNYNHARFLPDVLGSLLNQSYRPLEIVVLDDCSTDNSVEVVEEWSRRDPLIRLERNDRNRGVIYGINRLLSIGRGDFVYLSAADDLILPGFLDRCMELLAQHPQAGLCSTLTRIVDEHGTDEGVLPTVVVAGTPTYLPPERVRSTLRSLGFWIQGNTTIYRKAAIVDAGGYRPELHSFTDGFLAHVIALRHGACFIPEPLAAWRRMETSYAITSRLNAEIERETVRRATALMRNEFSDLFPADYADLWKEQMFFDWLRFASARIRRQQEEFLAEMQHLRAEGSLRQRAFGSMLSIWLRVQSALTQGLLLGFVPRQAVHRRLRLLSGRFGTGLPPEPPAN